MKLFILYVIWVAFRHALYQEFKRELREAMGWK